MNPNEEKISELREKLQMRLVLLERELEGVAPTQRATVEKTIEDVRERLGALSKIILRYSNTLRQVRQTIFVSTNFKPGGQVPSWITDVLKQTNHYARKIDDRFTFIFGNTEPGEDFQQAILEGIVDCYCFLSLVGTGEELTNQRGKNLLRPYLQEEIGVAFALGKPIVIAVQSPIDPTQIGLMYGGNRQRIVFEVTAGWQDNLAQRLANALKSAPRKQQTVIEERRKIVERLFF